MSPKKILSFVLPVFNESLNLEQVYNSLLNTLSVLQEKYEYEIVFIDDGSTDNSWSIIQEISEKDAHMRGVQFSRNFWQQVALEAGLQEITWDAVITMDSDGQHPTNVILEFIQKWEEWSQIVNTKRLDTENITLFKKITSALFYKTFNSLSGVKMESSSSDFRLLDRKVVDFLNTIQESPKFYRGILPWTGFKTSLISFHAAKRGGGKSGYSLNRMYALALLGITSCSLKPLKMIILFGLSISLWASALLIVAVVAKLMHSTYFSSAALWGSFILVNTGVIVVMLGILWIYNAHILSALSSRPSYIVKRRI